jgi:hypothetical protein
LIINYYFDFQIHVRQTVAQYFEEPALGITAREVDITGISS